MLKKYLHFTNSFISKFNPLNYMSIKLKLILSYSLIIMILIVTLQKVSVYYASSIITSQSLQYSQLLAEKMSSEIDKTVDELDRHTQTAISDEMLIKSLNEKGISSKEDNSEYIYIKTFMDRILNFRRDIDRIFIQNNHGEIFVSGVDSYIPYGYDMQKEEWYREFDNSQQLFAVLPPHLNEVNRVYEVFSVVRKIRTFSDSNIQGIIKIDRRTNILDEICKKGELEDNRVIILDKNGAPVYNTGTDLSMDEYSSISSELTGKKGTIKINKDEDIKVISYVKSEYTGLTTAFIVPEKILLKDLHAIDTTTIFIAIFSGIMALAFSIVISYAVTSSVGKLLKGMKKVEEGNLDTKVFLKSRDEVAILSKGFNSMIENIKVLMKSNAEMEVKKKEAEMMVLQGQIDPHFLYNTLDGIRMKAVINKDAEAAEMIEELSKLLRTCANVGKKFVTLQEELDYVKRYVSLQNIRYKQKFQMEIKIDDILLKMVVPMFILQPIIENAIYHGLEPKKNDRKILITGFVEGEKAIIKVFDNGTGMRNDELEALRASLGLEGEDLQAKIGLRNINRRLKLHYGEKSGIEIDSSYGEGTTVSLSF